jgi:ABC-type branched-subunit amino acid transport system substrate-binding protein
MERRTRVAVFAALAGVALLSSGCALLRSSRMPGDAAPVVKIGVIAPFEGEGRAMGYAVLAVVKGLVAEANANGSLGRYRASVVAFNDNLDPQTAAAQAQALALDPDIIAVIGPVTAPTIDATAPALNRAGLAGIPVLSVDPLNDDYAAEVATAEAVTRDILRGLAEDIAMKGHPSREGIAHQFARSPEAHSAP